MLDFQQKRKLRAFAYHRVTLVILAILVVFGIHSTWSVWQKERQSFELRKVAEDKNIELLSRQNDLTAKIYRMESPEGIEEEIRSKFDVAKENESLVIVLPDKISATSSQQGLSLWNKFINLFKP